MSDDKRPTECKRRELLEEIAGYQGPHGDADHIASLISETGFVLAPTENILNVANVGREVQAAIRADQRAKDAAIVRGMAGVPKTEGEFKAWNAALDEAAQAIENQTDE